MSKLKKFLIVFFSFLPFSAGAAVPFLIGTIAGVGVIAGFSIYRTAAPVNMADALSFFSSCWSCQMFSDIMSTMSGLLPRAYHAIGQVVIPVAIGLTAVWFAWKLLSGYLGINKVDEPWTIAGTFGTTLIKLSFVVALLAFPLPRFISSVVIEPIFNVGLSLNHLVTDEKKFDECLVATAVADPVSVDATAANYGAFSPNMRHNLTCELGGIHQMTGLGMATGWTMLNMSFNAKYMHKILWNVPFFPNVPIFFIGLLILALFFFALLPVPLYLLQIFIKLTMDLIMLPMLLLAWLFKGWKITDWGSGSIQGIIDDAIKGTLGIALTGVFVSFSVIFLNSVFGNWAGAPALQAALANNDSTILMDGLMMNNDSLITIILIGLFISMFMVMIPTLIETLFSISPSAYNKAYEFTKTNLTTLWGNIKKWWAAIKKV